MAKQPFPPPSRSGMLLTRKVKEYVKRLEKAGMEAKADWPGGLVRVLDNGKTCFWALQKGYDGPWIVRYTNTERVNWNFPPLEVKP